MTFFEIVTFCLLTEGVTISKFYCMYFKKIWVAVHVTLMRVGPHFGPTVDYLYIVMKIASARILFPIAPKLKAFVQFCFNSVYKVENACPSIALLSTIFKMKRENKLWNQQSEDSFRVHTWNVECSPTIYLKNYVIYVF